MVAIDEDDVGGVTAFVEVDEEGVEVTVFVVYDGEDIVNNDDDDGKGFNGDITVIVEWFGRLATNP